MITIDDFIGGFTTLIKQNKEPWEITASLPDLIRSLIDLLAGEFIIKDGVAIHTTAVVEEGAIIKAPAIIGPDCFVAAHAYLRGGVYAVSNVTIGSGCEIKSSIIFPKSSIAHFNFIGDSIIGNNVNIEAGAITANHHNDRTVKTIFILHNTEFVATDATKFGALIGDGTKIGANAVLSPGTILKKNTVVKRLELIDQCSFDIPY